MYNLPHFKEKDEHAVLEFMKQHPFAMIIGCMDNKSFATQIPLLFEEKENKTTLLGHMMRKQDHQLAFVKNPEVLVVFTGPHTYVSATWYEDPHQASTWNYMSVHARGKIKFLDEQGLINALQKLSSHYENENKHSPTVYNNLPADYTVKLIKSIVAFEIEVESIEHVFKLSQNRDEKSYQHVVDKLAGQDEDGKQIAGEMIKRKDGLFGS